MGTPLIEHPLEWDHWPSQSVFGMDEAGRGPIAGPVCIAGVQFPAGYVNPDIYDSKKLSEKKREALFDVILDDCEQAWIAFVYEDVIDQGNIYRVVQAAMEDMAAASGADFILTDAMPLRNGLMHEAIIKGDQKSLSIAAASILAKVSRDRYMCQLDKEYPQYGLAKHKGYPTKAHLEALEKYGVQPFHRKSYGPVAKMLEIKLF